MLTKNLFSPFCIFWEKWKLTPINVLFWPFPLTQRRVKKNLTNCRAALSIGGDDEKYMRSISWWEYCNIAALLDKWSPHWLAYYWLREGNKTHVWRGSEFSSLQVVSPRCPQCRRTAPRQTWNTSRLSSVITMEHWDMAVYSNFSGRAGIFLFFCRNSRHN